MTTKNDELYHALGFPLEIQDPHEFDKPENVFNLPLKYYINMSEKHAINTHLTNLIETYDLDTVINGLIKIMKERK